MWLPIATGAGIGAVFALLNRYCNVRVHIAPAQPLCVVLTGGSKGLGKALARELLLGGDRVLLTSRTQVCAARRPNAPSLQPHTTSDEGNLTSARVEAALLAR